MAALPSFWTTVAIASVLAVVTIIAMGLFGGGNKMPVEGKVCELPETPPIVIGPG